MGDVIVQGMNRLWSFSRSFTYSSLFPFFLLLLTTFSPFVVSVSASVCALGIGK